MLCAAYESSLYVHIVTITPPSLAYILLIPAVSMMMTSLTSVLASSSFLTKAALSGQLQWDIISVLSFISGTYEQYGEKNICIFDSESASSGETQYALKAMELQEKGLSFEDTVKELEAFREEMRTYFILTTAVYYNFILHKASATIPHGFNYYL